MKHSKQTLSLLISLIMITVALLGFGLASHAEESPDNSASLTVGDNIVSHYYIDAAYYRSKGCDSLSYSYNGTNNRQDYTAVQSDLISLGEEEEIVIDAFQAAAQLAEPTTIEIFRDGEVFDTVTYSSKTYCDSIINMNPADYSAYGITKGKALASLCKAIVAYGKTAQAAFNYSASTVEGATTITDDYSAELGLSEAAYVPSAVKTAGENVSFKSASFMCTSSAKMRFYLNVADESEARDYGDPEITAPAGISFEKGYVKNGSVKTYFIQLNNIKPVDFDKKLSVSYAGASVSMSVLDYAGTVINSDVNESYKNLAKALIVYNEKANEYFNGHELTELPAISPTCTENGSIAYYSCTDCGKLFADEDGEVEISLEDTILPALGHDYAAVVTEPTCTEQGYTTYTCARCGDIQIGDTTDALGHNFVAGTVVAPTCTEGGYTVYTCSRCGATENRDATSALGHSEGSWTVKTAATTSNDGEEVTTCSRCGVQISSRTVKKFTNKLPNIDSYLYRVGNANNVTLGMLFDSESGANITGVTATVTKVAGTAGGTFTANSSDWRSSTLKFTGLGPVTVTLKHGSATAATLKLEVVAGTNYADDATLGNVTSNNAVLLGNVKATSVTINNSKTLYGNGFNVTDARTSFTGAANAYIKMSGGGTIDNAVLLGAVYETAVTSGQDNNYYAPGVWIIGDANICNSYVSETKNAVQIDSGTVNLVNSTFAGGAIANVNIGGGTVTFENCTTMTSNRGGLKGLGIRPTTSACTINIKGTLTQYNWLKSSDLPSTYSSMLSSIYNDSTYAYTYDGTKYINLGIFFVTEADNITTAQAQAAINDETGNSYGYVEKTTYGITATAYLPKATMGSAAMLTLPDYDETDNGQYYLLPVNTFDYTNKNYIAKTDGSKEYCYYDSTTGKVMISFEKASSTSAFSWDPMILTVTKNGSTISNYTVKYKKSGASSYTATTGANISFSEAGDYEVVYTYTDPYNYDKNAAAFDHTYEKTVNISVVAAEPDQVTYYADFAYTGAAGTYDAKKVIGTDNKTYVMPDVSATVSGKIGSTTVAGKTVYFPIVTVGPTSSNGNTTYSSGKGYYFAPVFSELNITDYNQDTGAAQYTYNKSSTTWPHGNSSSTGPNTAYFTCASGEKTYSGTSPYARSMNSQYYGYGKNNYGLCYTSNDIEKDNTASTHTVQYHYVSNDGTTYYYYIQYSFTAMTYKSSTCVTEDTLITMADGSQKEIKDVEAGEIVMTFNHFTGGYEPQPVTVNLHHADGENRVLSLNFSDNTTVRMLYEHGFYDLDKKTYVYITEDNVSDYVGDRFVKLGADGESSEVVLTDYAISVEEVNAYEMATAYNVNYMVNGVLSTPAEDMCPGLYEYFEFDDNMIYDSEKMQADIDEYGLYTYEDFAPYITEEQFNLFNLRYCKANVCKGKVSFESIVEYARAYIVPNV